MRATKYNKSEIMKQAWMMFRSTFYGFTFFGEALSAAWRYAKEEVASKEAIEACIAAQAIKAMQPKAETKDDRYRSADRLFMGIHGERYPTQLTLDCDY